MQRSFEIWGEGNWQPLINLEVVCWSDAPKVGGDCSKISTLVPLVDGGFYSMITSDLVICDLYCKTLSSDIFNNRSNLFDQKTFDDFTQSCS